RDAAAPAAARRPPTVARHLDQLNAGNRAQQISRRVVDTGAAAQMAWVLVSDFFSDLFTEFEVAAARKLIEIFHAVNDADARQIVFGIFAPDPPAAAARGHNRAHPGAADRLDIHIPQARVFVAKAEVAGIQAAATLVRAENREIIAGLLHQLRERDRRRAALRPVGRATGKQ